MERKLIRLRPDGKPDEAFNEQAAKVMGEQHLGDYWLAAFDGQGRVIVGFRHGILRLDAEGSLLAPGPIPFDRVRIGKQTSGTLRGLVLHPDGSIFVSGGDERGGEELPWLTRFDDQMREDRAFSTRHRVWRREQASSICLASARMAA